MRRTRAGRRSTAADRAVVTGAAHGLGAAIAARLAARGLQVVVADVDLPAAEATAARIGGGARAHELDVRDADGCRALAGGGPLAVWCNNAGILATGPGWALDEAARRRLFDVNVHGVMNGTTAALAQMRPAGRGHVLNVASLAALTPSPSETIYGATKHAVLAFSMGTQLDLLAAGERGVRVSTICPDGMWTPMLHERARDPEAWPSWSGTMLTADAVAAATTDLLDRPRMVRSVPRHRGLQLRLFAAQPDLGAKLLPAAAALARRRQRAWADAHGVPATPTQETTHVRPR